LKNFAAQKSPPPGDRWGASAQSADEENIVSSKNSQFEANNTALKLNEFKLSLSFYQIFSIS